MADVVIALPHWGPEDSAIPTSLQSQLAEEIALAKPDLIVGNHTHVIQGYEKIAGVPVFYGLGNFVFDQNWTDHRQGAILLVTFQGRHFSDYRIIPTHVDQDGHVTIADTTEAGEILTRFNLVGQYLADPNFDAKAITEFYPTPYPLFPGGGGLK